MLFRSLDNNSAVEISLDENNTNLPADVVENTKGKDVELIVNVGSYQWSVNGMAVTNDSIADVNLGVKENQGIVPDEITNRYVDNQSTVEVNLEHEGQFGYEAKLKIFVGLDYAGDIASVLHYNPTTGRLEYQGNSLVDDKGYVDMGLSHASSYMVVMDTKAVGLPGDLNNDGKSELVDYVQFKQYLTGQEINTDTAKLVNVDMDGDNKITVKDAVLLARTLVTK